MIKIVVQVLADDMYVAAFESDLKKSAHGPSQEGAVMNLLRLHGGHLFNLEVIDHRQFLTELSLPSAREVAAKVEAALTKTTGLTWPEAESALYQGARVASSLWKTGYLEKDLTMLPHWAYRVSDEARPVAWPGQTHPSVVAQILGGLWTIVG